MRSQAMSVTILMSLVVGVVGRRIDPKHAKNITVYHVNPMVYGTTPLNMNTADLRGDMYFDLRTRALNLECGIWVNESFWSRLDCSNGEVITAPDQLAITKLVLEIDGRYGSYADCNIGGDDDESDDDTHYQCSCHSHVQARCKGLNETACGDYHHGTGYGCRWQPATKECDLWTCSNSTTKADCQDNYGHPADCGWDDQKKACIITSTPAPTPQPFGGVCNRSTVGMENLKDVDWGQHDVDQNLTQISAWHDNVMNKVGGVWFSTQSDGFCGHEDDENDGSYCSWRVAKVIKKIRKNCSDLMINTAVVDYDASSAGQGCFKRCSDADQANTSSICYTQCFYATVLGPNANHTLDLTGSMPIDKLEAAWESGFQSSDLSKGGCPAI